MARKKPPPNAEVIDVDLRRGVEPPAPRRVAFTSADPEISVTAWLCGKPEGGEPKPKYLQHERPGAFDYLQYQGHEAFEQTIPIKFDGEGERSVEGKVTDLYRLMRRTAKGGVEPPIVKAAGRGVHHPSYNWRVVGIDEDIGRRKYLDDSGTRCLYVARVTLRQQVAERFLAESLRRSRRSGRGQGVKARYTHVLAGETSLYQVAKRKYGDPSKAGDIATANPPLTLGGRLKVGRRLRIP